MIRTGTQHVIESREEFVNLTKFSKEEVLKANNIEIRGSISDLPESRVDELYNGLDTPIQSTLEADSSEWIHLYDGEVHTIVELEPQISQVWAEGEITPEGISGLLYREDSGQPTLLDEYWMTWADLIDGQESWASFQDVEIGTETFSLRGDSATRDSSRSEKAGYYRIKDAAAPETAQAEYYNHPNMGWCPVLDVLNDIESDIVVIVLGDNKTGAYADTVRTYYSEYADIIVKESEAKHLIENYPDSQIESVDELVEVLPAETPGARNI